MIKKLLVVSLAALGIGFMGCDNPISNDDTVNITLTAVPTINGDVYNITAAVEGNVVISNIVADVKKDDGSTPASITFTKDQVPSKEKISIKATGGDMKYTMNIGAATCNGVYTLTLTATAGTATTSKSSTFSVTGKTDCSIPVGTPVVTTTLIAGANKNANGSSIDLDGGIVWKMADAATNLAKIDLCYAHTAATAAVSALDKLGTPVWAQASGYDFAAAWVNPPVTKFYKTTLTAANFDAITTKEEIPAFVDASAVASSAAVTNDVFIVKTTEGAIVLVKITAQTPGEAGTITIKSAK